MMKNSSVDIVITTFKRNECLKNLLESIPDHLLKFVTIADQNKQTEKRTWRAEYPHVDVIHLPYDCGLSYARNELVRHTKRPYVLLMEDDFKWTGNTDINKMLKLMDVSENVGVVGGAVKQSGVAIPFEMIPTIRDGVLYHERDGDNWKHHDNIKYKETGCVMNFALFRRVLFDDCMWDEDLKLREHQDFYLRLQATKWIVLFTSELDIQDAKTRHTEEYRALKSRDEFMVMMMKKHSIHKIKYQNGSCRILKDDKIIKANEAPIQ